MTVPVWAWVATMGVFAVLIAADLVLTRSAAGLRAAALMSVGRALYVLLAGALDRFRYLRHGIALLLGFIGAKMLISPVVELPVTVSLGAILAVAAAAVAASLWRDRSQPRPEGARKGRAEGAREGRPEPAMRT